MRGVVCAIRDEGTVVLLHCQGERFFIVPFDHRAFRQMWEAEGGEVVGREVVYEHETVRFME
ncbi:MAG: hypothetical protein ACOX9R_08360 [Armatimonadota bacterium]|jgi:hypothetical protein